VVGAWFGKDEAAGTASHSLAGGAFYLVLQLVRNFILLFLAFLTLVKRSYRLGNFLPLSSS